MSRNRASRTAIAAVVAGVLGGGGVGNSVAAQVGAPGSSDRTHGVVLDLYVPALDGLEVTEATVALGRSLFSDARLSADGALSCAGCHRPDHAFTDGRRVSRGVGGRIGRRNVPSLINRGYGASFSWDGRAGSLLEQVLLPIENPAELGVPIDSVLARLGRDVETVRRFRDALGQGPTRSGLAVALAAYVATIRSEGAPFDGHFLGDTAALSVEERRGRRVFLGKAGCGTCHLGPNLTDEGFHVTGVAWREGRPDDPGRFGVTGDTTQLGAFKTPTLREVARTAPFMHDGSIRTLEDVVAFYDGGGIDNPFLDERLRPLGLTDSERTALVAFLRSLNGRVREGLLR